MFRPLFLCAALILSQFSAQASTPTRLYLTVDNKDITLLVDGNKLIGDANWMSIRPLRGEPWLAIVRTQDDKQGYINRQGEWLFPPEFDQAKGFAENGIARVKKNDRWGFVSRDGSEVIAPRFHYASPFYSGIALVRDDKDSKPYYINADGEEVFKNRFHAISRFTDVGLAAVAVGKSVPTFKLAKDKTTKIDSAGDIKWGYIDTQGEIVIEPQYVRAGNFNDFGIAEVEKDEDMTILIDKTGNPINAEIYDYVYDFSESGLARVRSKDDKFEGFINTKGEHVFEAKVFDFADEFNGLIRNDFNKFFDTTGNMVIEEFSSWARSFVDKEVTIALRDDKWGILHRDGRYHAFADNIVAPYSYDTEASKYLVGFQDGIIPMIDDKGEIVYFNRQGEVVYRFTANGKAHMQLLDASGNTIWQSAFQAQRLTTFLTQTNYFTDASDNGEGILATADALLKAQPRVFHIPNAVYYESDDPYEITEDIKNEAEENEMPLPEGAIKIIAEHYVDEVLWGNYYFLYDRQSEIFSADFQKLIDILSKKHGKPKKDDNTMTWKVNGKILSLSYLSDTGDGDFYNQIVLTATNDSGE